MCQVSIICNFEDSTKIDTVSQIWNLIIWRRGYDLKAVKKKTKKTITVIPRKRNFWSVSENICAMSLSL